MKLRNAFRILTDNFSNTYKLLLYHLVTGIIFFALSYAVLNLGLGLIFQSEELKAVFELVGNFFEAVATGKTAFLETFQENFIEALTAFLVVVSDHVGSIIGSVVGVFGLYLVSRFLNGVAHFAMGSILSDKMDSYSKTGFPYAYFKNIGRAMLYEVIYVPVSFVYDALCIAFCWFFFFYTPSLFSAWGIAAIVLGLSISVAFYLCLQAFKMTVISAWIPAIVTGESVTGGLKTSLKSFRKGFGGRYSTYLITLYLIFIANFACGLCTIGSALLITVPASYLLILSLQLVYYFEDSGKKYYLSLNTIAGDEEKNELAE